MIRLTNTTTDLLACTPSSTNVVKTMVSFTDVTASTWTGNSEPHSLAAASKATICATPAASTVREIDHVTISASGGANTVTVLQTISATDYQLISVALTSGDMLEYTHASGWRVTDSNGSIRQTFSNITGNLAVGGTLSVTGATTLSSTLAVTGATTLSSALTYGGVTLSNAVTGTGSMVLSASPTFTGTAVAATLNATTLGGTLSTAAQPNVTSLGTLTSLTSSGAISGTTLTLDKGSAGNYGTLGNTKKWYLFDDVTYATLMTGINGTGQGIYASATSVGLVVGSTFIALATSTGLAVTGTISTTATSGTGTAVIIDGSSILRPLTSSERFKTITEPNWQPSDAQIAAFLAVSPMVSHYTDNDFGPMEGFSAERLAEVDPLLVNWDAEGKPYSLREHAILAYQHAIIAKLYKELH